MQAIGNLKVSVKREDLLKALKNNREQHIETLRAARAGYCARATDKLTKRLAMLKEGRAVPMTGLAQLQPPLEYTREYDTVISMLEMHTEPTIEIDATQARAFFMDDWQWKAQFISSTQAYTDSED